MKLFFRSLLVVLGITFSASIAAAAIDLSELKSKLETTGLVGEVHGVHLPNALHTFTYRNPADFFDYVTLPLVAANPEILNQLNLLERHQSVRLFGSFVDHSAPITHLLISKVEILSTPDSETKDHVFIPKTPISEITEQTQVTGRVHAVSPQGEFFVLEYKDLVLPVFVRLPAHKAIAQKLYRGDLIKLSYRVRAEPDQPVHLSPQSTDSAIQVLERIQDCHEKTVEIKGSLVKFPKSPQILNDTYAVLVEDFVGTTVQYTLMNFEKLELNAELRKALAAAWVQAPKAKIENGRNKLIHRGISITARGQCNVVSQAQANPQILFKQVSDIQISMVD